MKITQQQLKQIIKEEVNAAMEEDAGRLGEAVRLVGKEYYQKALINALRAVKGMGAMQVPVADPGGQIRSAISKAIVAIDEAMDLYANAARKK